MIFSRTALVETTAMSAVAVLFALPVVALGATTNAHHGTIYRGKEVSIGKGVAQVVVRANSAGKPRSVAVMLTHGALEGLPTKLNPKTSEGEWEYSLPMPVEGPKTGYTHVVIDWNPHGHPPPHIYTVPHFDFHFYLASREAVEHVAFSGPKDPATKVTDKGLMALGYKVIPETAVANMGVHAVNLEAPEFHGKPFTATFIYGYYKNKLTFIEPMVTRAFLEKNPMFSKAVNTPEHYSFSGYYPTSYSVRYIPRWKSYVISLRGLKEYQKAPSANAAE